MYIYQHLNIRTGLRSLRGPRGPRGARAQIRATVATHGSGRFQSSQPSQRQLMGGEIPRNCHATIMSHAFEGGRQQAQPPQLSQNRRSERSNLDVVTRLRRPLYVRVWRTGSKRRHCPNTGSWKVQTLATVTHTSMSLHVRV